jgi:hypothetical protein
MNGGSTASLQSPSPSGGAPWSIYIPAQQGAAVTFQVYAGSGNGSLFNLNAITSGKTSSVNNTDITDISIDIGNITPNTLRVNNPPAGTYTVYVSNSIISGSNYNSVKTNPAYSKQGTGSSISSFTWPNPPSSNSKAYHILIVTAENVMKYVNNVIVYPAGIASVNWSTMTTIAGGGGGGGGDDELTSNIDASLQGTWKDNLGNEYLGTQNGEILTMTFTASTVTWGGTSGASIDSIVGAYVGLGYTAAWVAADGKISYVYIDPNTGKQTIPIYDYVINGAGELELKYEGITILTLIKG